MNRDQARNRIKITFTRPFNRENFRTFILNVLNRIDESKAQAWNTQYVKDAFKPHVQRYERLGTYTSPKKEKLDVLIVHLTNASKLERARTAMRNFVADHLKTRDEKDAALVAFVSPTEKQWRFSYVKMDYATVKTESGKVGVEARLTPARRFSYLVGEGESSHTAQSRFVDLLQDTQSDPTLAQIEEAFSVEAVTKEFFTKYAELFEQIDKALTKLVEKDKAIREEFKAKNVNTVDFAKKLMGQIVFLYFLQKKGWLGVEKGKEWGTGPRDFLRRLANGQYGKYDNFFNDVLEPLFYDTLATDRGHEAWDKRFNCRIPFLNGGLFEPLGDYDWRKTNIILPNKLFTNNEFVEEGITGTGVLDVFDRYNFTVNEAEPLEKEVAIDPEMLGKVFENLIEENRRKGLGAYYTPREIVHYMCQESLINYLDTAVNKDKPLIPRADIETFVHLGEQISHYEAVETEYRVKMPKSITENARLIDETLADITVCDPAVGSGAFPVGMMTEIVRARMALTPYFNDPHERSPYFFKRHAVQNCLYGVDIDSGAVEIAKLRLWLSLVVDEEDVKQIKPLPNLSYKIVVGNSLLGVEKNLFNNELFDKLEKLKARYFDEPDKEKKDRYKEQIEQTIHELTNGNEVFDFEIYFSEVFHRNGGFDVVIANPPYIDGQFISRDELQFYKERFRSAEGKVNLFNLLIERGVGILRSKGCLTFIVPTPILRNSRYRSIRSLILEQTQIETIVVFNDLPFESAVVENVVLVLQKGLHELKERPTKVIFDFNFVAQHMTNQLWFSKAKDKRFLVTLTNDDMQIIDRLKASCIPLGEICNIRDGISTGFKPFPEILLGKKVGSKFVSANGKSEPFDPSVHKKIIDGGEFTKYSPIHWEGRYIKYDKQIEQNPRPPKGKPFNCQLRDRAIFESSTKILSRQTSDRLIATLDTDRFYTRNSIHNLIIATTDTDIKYILGLFNSRLLNFIYQKTTEEIGKVLPQVHIADLKELPIPKPDKDQQMPIIQLVDRILAAKKRNPEADTSALEREIDQLVYKLYGLTEEEIKIVEGASK
jgi:hypothetical protein